MNESLDDYEQSNLCDEPDAVPVIELGVEGGSITLEGRYSDGVWRFRVRTYDCADDEDFVSRCGPWRSRWDEAIADLDRWAWDRFVPLSVHPDFVVEVRRIIAARAYGPRHRQREWEEVFATSLAGRR